MDMSTDSIAIEDTQSWLRRAVIGLNLCPFAKAVDVKQQIHYAVTHAIQIPELLQVLECELHALAQSQPSERDTTLLIAVDGFSEFLEFNALLIRADRLLVDLGYEGVFQIASLHPRYQFAGTDENDITNYTNRSPYPTLHLLREQSIDRAVNAFPHAESIYETNMETMERLGLNGWNAMGLEPRLNRSVREEN
jgi:uncharacterized protein